jgi:hypothetical protein
MAHVASPSSAHHLEPLLPRLDALQHPSKRGQSLRAKLLHKLGGLALIVAGARSGAGARVYCLLTADRCPAASAFSRRSSPRLGHPAVLCSRAAAAACNATANSSSSSGGGAVRSRAAPTVKLLGALVCSLREVLPHDAARLNDGPLTSRAAQVVRTGRVQRVCTRARCQRIVVAHSSVIAALHTRTRRPVCMHRGCSRRAAPHTRSAGGTPISSPSLETHIETHHLAAPPPGKTHCGSWCVEPSFLACISLASAAPEALFLRPLRLTTTHRCGCRCSSFVKDRWSSSSHHHCCASPPRRQHGRQRRPWRPRRLRPWLWRPRPWRPRPWRSRQGQGQARQEG